MHRTLCELSKELECLEIDACAERVVSSERVELIANSRAARNELDAARSNLRREMAQHLVKKNTVNNGLICWLKHGSLLHLSPEPLNLKEVLKYLVDHTAYYSTGYDVYDIYFDDLETQVSKISTLLGMRTKPPGVRKVMSFEKVNRLRDQYFPDGQLDTVDYSHFIKSTNDITSTAVEVIQFVIDKQFKVSSTAAGNS